MAAGPPFLSAGSRAISRGAGIQAAPSDPGRTITSFTTAKAIAYCSVHLLEGYTSLTRPRAFEPSHAAFADVAACKCCGARAEHFGAVDFHRSCEDVGGALLAASGIAIPYHRCVECGFVFTLAFDHFTPQDFAEHIYNDDYVRVDPDFAGRRPLNSAELVGRKVFPGQTALRMLDYGGGEGRLAALLREMGFASAVTYDPFYAGSGSRPTGTFDVVTSFEVLEHTTTPYETLREMRALTDDRGMILFSTLVQPPDFDELGMRWFYAAPRNGHVSLYSRQSMTALMRRLGLKWCSFDHVLHAAYRGKLPRFAQHLERAIR